MNEHEREFVLDQDALRWLGALVPETQSRISPFVGGERQLTAAQWARLGQLGVLEVGGSINPNLSRAIDVLASTRTTVQVEIAGPPGFFAAAVYTAPYGGSPVALMGSAEGIAVRDPAPVAEILITLDQALGHSVIGGAQFDAELSLRQARVLAAMCDCHRPVALLALADGRVPEVQATGSEAILAALGEIQPERRGWLTRTLDGLVGRAGDLSEDAVRTALDGLADERHVEASDGRYRLCGAAAALADGMLIRDNELRVNAMRQDVNDTVERTAFVCLQSGAHDLLFMARADDVVQMQSVSAATALECARALFQEHGYAASGRPADSVAERPRRRDAATAADGVIPTPSFATTEPVRAVSTSSPAWQPTHEVKRRAQAWERPDPTATVTGTIERRVAVQLLERQGEWARVVCSNGWSAWVDGRDLKAH